METSLHRELKRLMAGDESVEELPLAGFRIDAIVDGRLIEVQVASLAAIRAKTIQLLEQGFELTVVKPLTARKQIVRRDRRDGPEVSRRWSPRRQKFADVFDELVNFLGAFPHPRLTLELLLITEEETRLTRTKRWSRQRNYRIEDRHLQSVEDRRVVRTAADLLRVLPPEVLRLCARAPFTTSDLAVAAEVNRSLAQKIAYCFRKLGVWKPIGKRQRAWLYQPTGRNAA
ncbi:MAG: hypothetical protein FD138_992 [Planctomycetota bacterium]|nr:MAG: hypothetical protein FD138_992 [Planctomycetota bacterium]